MTEEPKPPDEGAIIDAYKSGRLLHAILNRFNLASDSDLDSTISMCVDLHNTGKVNLLSLTKGPEFEAIGLSHFFTGQHFFCKAIPKLFSPTKEMMNCVRALVDKGGTDLAANFLNAAFKDWCAADLARAQEVVDGAHEGDVLAQKFLTFALTAGNMIEDARGFVEKYTDGRRLAGVAALGRTTYANVDVVRETLSTLLRALDRERDDELSANVLTSALDMAEKSNQISTNDTLKLVVRACESAGPSTQFCCARALWVHKKSLSAEVVAQLLQALNLLEPSHKGTIRELDSGLRELLDTPFSEQGIQFVTRLLSSPEPGLALSDFPSFGEKLIEGFDARFQRSFVSWMLSGKRSLCEGVSALLQRRDSRDTPICLQLQDLSSVEQIFLCRKAIGYFFLQPVFAASVLVSALRVGKDEVVKAVGSLLFDPLLVNYGGISKGYLVGIDVNDPAYTSVQWALKMSEQYMNGLASVSKIRELHPSEHQRQVERLCFHDRMQVARKEAEKQSVFLNLVRRSVILYGKRSLMYVTGPANERKAVEMDLNEVSVSLELPRGEITDPVGLDYMLRVFRAERLRS